MKGFAIHLGTQVVALLVYAGLIVFIVWGQPPAEWSNVGRFFVALFWLIFSAIVAAVTHAGMEDGLA